MTIRPVPSSRHMLIRPRWQRKQQKVIEVRLYTLEYNIKHAPLFTTQYQKWKNTRRTYFGKIRAKKVEIKESLLPAKLQDVRLYCHYSRRCLLVERAPERSHPKPSCMTALKLALRSLRDSESWIDPSWHLELEKQIHGVTIIKVVKKKKIARNIILRLSGMNSEIHMDNTNGQRHKEGKNLKKKVLFSLKNNPSFNTRKTKIWRHLNKRRNS